MQETINPAIPWGFFDGEAGGEPSCCSGGVVLHFNLQNHVTFKEGFGEGTNNFVKLCALILLMSKDLEWGMKKL